MFLPLLTRFVSRLPSIKINNATYATYATKAPFINNVTFPKQFLVNNRIPAAIFFIGSGLSFYCIKERFQVQISNWDS